LFDDFSHTRYIRNSLESKFLIAYKLPEKAAELAESVSADVCRAYGVADPHRRIPPHATLKSPFRANQKQINSLKRKLKEFAKNQQVGEIALSGFDHFKKRVLYLDIKASDQARKTIDTLTEMLTGINWLTVNGHDQHVVLHTTVARAQSVAEFEEIWSYLQENYSPDEKMNFNSISLLQLNTTDDNWETCNEFNF